MVTEEESSEANTCSALFTEIMAVIVAALEGLVKSVISDQQPVTSDRRAWAAYGIAGFIWVWGSWLAREAQLALACAKAHVSASDRASEKVPVCESAAVSE